MLVDLTPVVDGTGPSRLLDMISDRSAKVLTDWLGPRDQEFRDRIKVVTMDGFAGYHSAAAKAVPAARTVMDPFHVVHLAADKLTVCHQRIQQATTGHQGRAGDPLYGIRRTLNTCQGADGVGLIDDHQHGPVLLQADEHLAQRGLILD